MRGITWRRYADVKRERAEASGFSIQICTAKTKEKIKPVFNLLHQSAAGLSGSSSAAAAMDSIDSTPPGLNAGP